MQYAARQSYRSPPRSKRKPLLIGAAVILIIIICFAKWSGSGSKAVIGTPADSKPTVVGDKTFDDGYITFRYKGMYTTRSADRVNGQLDATLFIADVTYVKQIGVSVAPLPKTGITSDSGYLTRQIQPDVFMLTKVTVAGAAVDDWVSRDGKEQAIFIPHNGLYAVLAFSVANTNASEKLQPEVAALLQSFRWK